MKARPFLAATALFCGTALAGPTVTEAPRMTANTKAPPDPAWVWSAEEIDAEAQRLLAPGARTDIDAPVAQDAQVEEDTGSEPAVTEADEPAPRRETSPR